MDHHKSSIFVSIIVVSQTESFGYEIWTTDEGNRYQSHFAFLAGLFVYFWLLDRQNEYIHLLDFQVNGDLYLDYIDIFRMKQIFSYFLNSFVIGSF